MKVEAHTRKLLVAAALALVAFAIAGPANAGHGTVPYLSQGAGVDESLWSNQQTPMLTGVHAALSRRDRADTGGGASEQALGLTGDSPLTRASAPESQGLAGDTAVTRYPRQVPITAEPGENDLEWTSFGAGAALAALLAAGIAGVLLSTRRRHTVGLP